MEGNAWGHWLRHVMEQGRVWLYVALMLSNIRCLHITEVLTRRARVFDWKRRAVRIGALKRQRETLKHMLRVVQAPLRKLRTDPIVLKRKAHNCMQGLCEEWDTWAWPLEPSGFLFPAQRPDSKTTKRVKGTVCKAISHLRHTFWPPKGMHVTAELIRSHSGRHRMINGMKRAIVAEEVGMMYARIKDRMTPSCCLSSCLLF